MSQAHADVLALTKTLLAIPSVTPDDHGCLDLLTARLQPLGFDCQRYDIADVSNLYAVLPGSGRFKNQKNPEICFVGHTDVVPTGPEALWTFPPFEPTSHEGFLYGRGAVDMKTSIAAFIVAIENLLSSDNQADHPPLALLLTSDEEGPATHGVQAVLPILAANDTLPKHVLIGEPSSDKTVGDRVRVGRRGSINFDLTVEGIQGHVAYPDQVINPIVLLSKIIAELSDIEWDQGLDSFPATSFQSSFTQAGTEVFNVVPQTARGLFNLRFSPAITSEQIEQKVRSVITKHAKTFELEVIVSAQPFYTADCAFIGLIQSAIEQVCGLQTELSTSGGTSDGRFIAPLGIPTVELGPHCKSLHSIDERIPLEALPSLVDLYTSIVKQANQLSS